MPIYAYRCEACGFAKDALQKISDAPLTDCPECGKPELRKQVTAAGFQLKGTGWYVTDFRGGANGSPGGNTTAPAKAESSGDASTGGATTSGASTSAASSAGATDSKPAAAAT
jgi:putative FmdB family regulatory protein